MSVMDVFNGALTFNQQMFRQLRASPQMLLRGMQIILLVGLLVGSVQSLSSAISLSNPTVQLNALRDEYDAALDLQAQQAQTDVEREVIRIARASEDAFIALIGELIALPPGLPVGIVLAMQTLGSIVSTPLSYLSGHLLAVIVTHITARQLGGRGGIREMVGLGALAVAPHALDALSFIPLLSGPLGTIAWGWGLAILVNVTAQVHGFDSGRALLAVILYPAALLLVGFVLFCALLLIGAALPGAL
jgi:hypothetical protein